MSEGSQHVADIVEELQAIIDDEKTTAADKLKALAMTIDLLGLKPKATAPAGGSSPIDESFHAMMDDPILRKRALKLEEDTQKSIERATK